MAQAKVRVQGSVHELLVQKVQAVQSLRSVQAPSFILILTSLQIDIEGFMFM